MYSKAVDDLERAIRFEPKNMQLRNELDDIEELLEFEGDGDFQVRFNFARICNKRREACVINYLSISADKQSETLVGRDSHGSWF